MSLLETSKQDFFILEEYSWIRINQGQYIKHANKNQKKIN